MPALPEGSATWAEADRTPPGEEQESAFAGIDPAGTGPQLFFGVT